MNLRPIDKELTEACAKTRTCLKCPTRQACPIRNFFYLEDLDFEMNLQTTELFAAMIFGKKDAYLLTQDLRSKRYCELKDYPDKYSFN